MVVAVVEVGAAGEARASEWPEASLRLGAIHFWVPLQCSLLIGLRHYHSNLSFLADICLRLLTKNLRVVAHFFDGKKKLSNIGVKSHRRLNNIEPFLS